MHKSLMTAAAAVLSLSAFATAQTVTEIAAPTIPVSTIDMDAVGPPGPTTLGAINAAGTPNPATISNITLTPSTAAAGVYNTNPGQGRALALQAGQLILVDPPTGTFDAFNASIDLGGPSTEFGIGIGDWVGPMILDFYSGGSLVTSFTSSTYSTAAPKTFQMAGGTFDRVDIRASTTAGNWVITDLLVENCPNCARAEPYGSGCGSTAPSTFYELFDGTNPNDLQNTGITLNWTGQTYVITQGANAIVTPSGAPTTFADDQTIQISLPWAYPIQGGTGMTNSVWVCSNGFVALEPTTSTDWTESVPEFLSGPQRFAVYWDDFNPSGTGGGTIHAEQDPANPALFHITWTGVPEFPAAGANDFQLTLQQTGSAEFKWGVMSSTDGLVGYTQGNGSPDPGGTDISAITALPLGTGRDDLALVSVARPVLGTTAMTQTQNIPAGSPAGFIVYGILRLTPPIDLTALGAPGCFQHISLDVANLFVPAGPTATHNFAIPNNMALVGANLNVQSAVVDLNFNTLGVISSNGIAWTANVQ